MASEAQRLIGISLSKIAQSRSHRGGVSLHKNLLVATVLQKARYIFMEEAYNMVHYQPTSVAAMQEPQPPPQVDQDDEEEELVVALTAEEAVAEASATPTTTCAKCQDKENHPPYATSTAEVTYLDLDKTSNVLRERSNSLSLKRRRAIAEWETEEAVQSILPKRSRSEDDSDDSVFLEDAATLLSDAVSKEVQQQEEEEVAEAGDAGNANAGSMEIDRITSLVSIFSFSMGDGKLNRSVSAPDLCSAQAKDAQESIQQRQFLAMTV